MALGLTCHSRVGGNPGAQHAGLVPVALTCSVFRPVFSNLVRRKCRYAYVTLALDSRLRGNDGRGRGALP